LNDQVFGINKLDTIWLMTIHCTIIIVLRSSCGDPIANLSVSLGPHDAYFRMRTLKPQVAKASTVASVMRETSQSIY